MKNKFHIPFKVKLILFTIIQYGGAILLGILLNRLLQIIFFLPLFHIFRRKYAKTYHASDFVQCTIHTFIMLIAVCLISLPLHISLIFIVLLSYITTDILYYLEDYLQLLKAKQLKISYGMNEELLIDKCKELNLSQLETDVLVMFYCRRMKRYEIGIKLNYSEDNISKIKSKALSKFA